MTDIVERLRSLARCEHDDVSIWAEAADEIERLRAALQEIIDIHQSSTAISIARAAIRARGQGQGGTE